MRSWAFACVIACAPACGRLGFDAVAGDASGDDAGIEDLLDPVDGTRLRTIYAVGDSARLPIGWHDTELGVDCNFLEAADGSLRCVPLDLDLEAMFADAACTEQLASVWTDETDCGSMPRYVVHSDESADGGPENRIVAVYETTGLHTDTIYEMNGGCVPVASEADRVYYRVGATVNLSVFVAATEERTRQGDVSTITWVAEDGARALSPYLFDHRHNRECVMVSQGGDRGLCVDPTSLGLRGFADPACAGSPLVVTLLPGSSDTALLLNDDVCDGIFRFVELGAPHTGAAYINIVGCTGGPLDTPTFEMGADITAQLISATHELLPGTGRLRRGSWRTPEGFVLPDFNGLWDTERNYWCTPKSDTTDRLICAPGSILDVGGAGLYSDPSCETIVTGIPTCWNPGWATQQTAGEFRQTCNGSPSTYHLLDAPVAGPFYLQTDTGCLPFTESAVVAENPTPLPDAAHPVMTIER